MRIAPSNHTDTMFECKAVATEHDILYLHNNTWVVRYYSSYEISFELQNKYRAYRFN